ncbi:hypothetical protein J3F84DRAFT_364902, partial [Trichoderma pleuroticola]
MPARTDMHILLQDRFGQGWGGVYSELLGGRRVDDDTITAAMHTLHFFFLLSSLCFIYLTFISSNSLSLFFLYPHQHAFILAVRLISKRKSDDHCNSHYDLFFFFSLIAPIYTRERRGSFSFVLGLGHTTMGCGYRVKRIICDYSNGVGEFTGQRFFPFFSLCLGLGFIHLGKCFNGMNRYFFAGVGATKMDYCVQDYLDQRCVDLLDEWFIPSWMQQCTYQYPLLPFCISVATVRRLGNVTHQVSF